MENTHFKKGFTVCACLYVCMYVPLCVWDFLDLLEILPFEIRISCYLLPLKLDI